MTQMAMNECADSGFRKADDAFKAVYKKLLDKTSLKGRGKLQSAQEAWTTYRDAQCLFNTLGMLEGSAYPTVYARCLADLTRQQTNILREQLDCEDGNLSCGGQ